MNPFLSIVIPVLDEAENLPFLFEALEEQLFASDRLLEIIFIDNRSSDDSLQMLRDWQKQMRDHKKIKVRLFEEEVRGFAPPLNLGIKKARADIIAITDADTAPERRWAAQMYRKLQTSDIVVGETISKTLPAETNSARYSDHIFREFSRKAAAAEEHLLPWGPTCNLGFRRDVFRKVGQFTPEAHGAFDIDWCWRACLLGYTIDFAEKAVVTHYRRTKLTSLMRQMHRYGEGEAWLAKQYGFLVDNSKPNLWQKLVISAAEPLRAGVDAYKRIQKKTEGVAQKPLEQMQTSLTNLAFSAGVVQGHFRSGKRQNEKQNPRRPARPISLRLANGRIRYFDPRHGVTELESPAQTQKKSGQQPSTKQK